jgi:CRP-like cAMP-binding protein
MAQRLATNVLLLERVPLFKPLTARELLQISSKLLTRSYEAGAPVITLGETGNAMFIVEGGGALAVSEQGAQLKEYKPGDFFGELSLVDDAPRRATVLAVGATTCLELRRDDFLMLRDRCQEVLQQFSSDYKSRSEKLRAYKEFLKETEYFKGLSERALLRLAAQVQQVKREHDEHVIIEVRDTATLSLPRADGL